MKFSRENIYPKTGFALRRLWGKTRFLVFHVLLGNPKSGIPHFPIKKKKQQANSLIDDFIGTEILETDFRKDL